MVRPTADPETILQTVAHLVLAVSIVLVAGCERVGSVTERVRDRFGGAEEPAIVATDAPARAIAAPDVSGSASWDGVPSLGGIWVAHPDVVDPARVRIARADGGGSVEGWLFRREAGGEVPPLQVSSEAAAALGLAAEKTVELIVEPLDGAPPAQEG